MNEEHPSLDEMLEVIYRHPGIGTLSMTLEGIRQTYLLALTYENK